MSSKKGLALAMLLLFSLLLAACGEEAPAENPGTLPATPLSMQECSSAAAAITAKAGAVTPTPNPTAGVRVDLAPETRLFVSNTFPYALAVPESWEVKDGQSQGNLKADLFVIRKGNTSGTHMTVISEKLNGTMDTQAYFDTKIKEATASGKFEFQQQPDTRIGDSQARVISFNTPAGQTFNYPAQIIQLIFTGQGRGWVVSFTSSPNNAGQYCPYFARALASWTFTNLQK
ncbi:MAG TPA: hypothetical protein VH186_11355 [Chloroflexia bacterium]|nr:hypothetical protein [Chloroflexia bacterium]